MLHGPSLPFPQIYYQVNADQWQSISLHGYVYDNGQPRHFNAALAQDGADTTHEAHDWLLGAVNSDSRTHQSDFVNTSLQRVRGYGLHDG